MSPDFISQLKDLSSQSDLAIWICAPGSHLNCDDEAIIMRWHSDGTAMIER